ncbi:hypothetical protein BN946_scf184766.g1 [Trametes cinnabarina]|uniref:ZW10 C-terminal helical domain-containing protein n=1 Tax=Pycnoporus cinnabarinus TaxID=5643 RepID=A0A060S6C6_PYCCI|nr:hypothetical protein BN946_scf184766.g1 [Trametes cinnabarina]
MAFPIPSHLPRKKDTRDVSTQILTKISETTLKDLNAKSASDWVSELDNTLRITKKRIHDRISSDLPEFQRQYDTAVSVQERLRSLSDNVDVLEESITDPQNAPEPLQRSEVMADLKRRCTALGNRTAEQLVQAYNRSITISTSEVIVRPTVQVPQSALTFPLTAILASMTPSALATHISTLRRDILAHCVDYVLKQPIAISEANSSDISGPAEHKITLYPAPPGETDLIARLDDLTIIMTFLNDYLLPHFPAAERKSLALSLSTPLRTAILNQLLLPHLPSSLSKLPDYLLFAERAVQVEDQIVVKMLGDATGERSIKAWVDNIGLHYERKRRAEILDRARAIFVSPDDEGRSFRVEVTLDLEERSPSIPAEEKVQTANGTTHDGKTNGNGHHEAISEEAESAWDFEEETTVRSEESSGNGWGFDDDAEPDVTPQPHAGSSDGPAPNQPPTAEGTVAAENTDDAWGWNDDTSPTAAEDEAVEDPWDDPWDEKPSEPEPTVSSPITAPKPAKGLQKFPKSTPSTPAIPPQSSPSQAQARSLQSPPPTRSLAQQTLLPMQAKPTQVTESYVVSGRTKDLLQLLEDVLHEGTELVSSGVLKPTVAMSPGNLLMQAAPMALELFRALVPIANATLLQQSPKEPMRFANDCRFVGEELVRIVSRLTGPKAATQDKLQEGVESLRVLADSWFEDAIAKEERLIDKLLDGARGFIDTTHQERYDECESAINEVLQRIRRVVPEWKAVLAKSRYYDALGALVETAISRVLGDILALEDITEVESHRLSELCRILNALEGLFVEDPEQPSFVVSYVPSWLKFSYLSELLEASIADISYLFEEGALVDFEIDELVKLVRALFADTPLRASTISRLLQGHPVRGS